MPRLLALVLTGGGWYAGKYEQCRHSTTVEIVQCVDRLTAQWQGRLNRAYEEAF